MSGFHLSLEIVVWESTETLITKLFLAGTSNTSRTSTVEVQD